MKYTEHYSTTRTPQSQPVPGKKMVLNEAGGYVFEVDAWTRMERFLILGSEGGSYYVGEQKLTVDNANAVMRCLDEDGHRAVDMIVAVSSSGRAPKNDPALFALAMASGHKDEATRTMAMDVLPLVARIPTHLFMFLEMAKAFRGRGRAFKRGVANWYQLRDPGKLAYQMVKYRSRHGWTHRDVLRVVRPVPVDDAHDALYGWAVGKTSKYDEYINGELPDWLKPIYGFEYVQVMSSPKNLVNAIQDYGLPWEALPTQALKEPDVWAALLPNMPMTALIRNLGRMSAIGLIKPMSAAAKLAANRIANQEVLIKARVHPISVLVAQRIYNQGHGMKGSMTWTPAQNVVDALDEAFYLAFGAVEPTGKRHVLALDVSGSMDWGDIAGLPLTPRVAAAAMALVTAAVEPEHYITAYSHKIVDVNISPKMRLDQAMSVIDSTPMGGTDAALPFLHCLQENIEADVFITYNDNVTWAGATHPFQALQEYRRKFGPTKSIVVSMLANQYSVGDTDDAGVLDVVGFDTATPNLISDFVRSQ